MYERCPQSVHRTEVASDVKFSKLVEKRAAFRTLAYG